MGHLDIKTDVIKGLHNKGYYFNYTLSSEFLRCMQDDSLVCPDDFAVSETHLCNGDDEHCSPYVILAIDLLHDGTKGILTAPYSAFLHGLSIHLWAKLSVKFDKALGGFI